MTQTLEIDFEIKDFDSLDKAQTLLTRFVRENGKRLVEDSFKLLFENYPDVEAVRWTQYTPYFNDGDTCTFSVHDGYVKLKDQGDVTYNRTESYDTGERTRWGTPVRKSRQIPTVGTWEEFSNEYSDYEDGFLSPWTLKRVKYANDVQLNFSPDSLNSVIGKILGNHDCMEMAFGDHVRVTVTREGAQVDHYDHD